MARLTKLNRSIAGRVAVVTGAASGMGRATAHLFADEGAKVAVVDRVTEGVDKVVGEITEAGGTARGYVLDVSEASAIPAVVDRIRDDLGPIDILVNNAGMSRPSALTSEDWEDAWALTFEVNLTAQARLVRACHDDLVRNGDGRIVNIASTEGLGATKGMSPYTASKTGVIGLTRSLALEYGDIGVTVNCICPGPIRTGMTAEIPDAAKDKFARRRVPMRRYGDPEEVAQITLSLVLPAASYLNGAIIPVDGGMMAQNT
jgi:3-oxoacyl-[acyl-carrier protein] reductase